MNLRKIEQKKLILFVEFLIIFSMGKKKLLLANSWSILTHIFILSCLNDIPVKVKAETEWMREERYVFTIPLFSIYLSEKTFLLHYSEKSTLTHLHNYIYDLTLKVFRESEAPWRLNSNMVCLEKSWMIKFFWECFLTSFIFHHKEEWEWRSLYLVLLRCLILLSP